ncbi:MAG: hypothetical protein ACOX4D_08865 [Bacteroidales bacterium]|jgi:hypothetical protein
MKKILKALALILFIVSFTSCIPDPEPSSGYSAYDIDGKWLCTEINSGKISYDVKIKAINESTAEIQNLGNLGNDVVSIANISNSVITIKSQSVCDGEWEVGGSGFIISKSKIELDFYLDDGKNYFDINSSLTR